MDGGTYTLVLDRRDSTAAAAAADTVTVGALGDLDFSADWYAYTGSALGPGGFSRVDRHRRVADGSHDARHWHVDYLLGDGGTRFDTVVTTAADIECAVARRLCERFAAVPEFGCSDCDCRSHLVAAADREGLFSAIEDAHGAAAASASTPED